MAQQRYYTPDSKFKAGRPFTMNGESYNFDDPVDVTGIEPRRLNLMFEARLLEVDDRPAAQRKRSVPVQAEKPSGAFKVKNGGFGRWYVTNADNENVAGPFEEKAMAQAALAKLQ